MTGYLEVHEIIDQDEYDRLFFQEDLARPSGHHTASESARELSGDQTAVNERYSYPQKAGRFTAIVQPIFYGVKNELFSKYGFVFGCNEKPSDDSCGKVRAKIMCSVDSSHPAYFKHERCNDPGCPVCYPKFVIRIADAVTERVQGYRSVFGFDPISHLIFWPEYRKGYSNLKEAFDAAKVRLNAMGAKMAVVWYHPYRIPNEIKEQLRRYKRAYRLDASIGFWQLAHDDVLGLGCLEAYVVPGPHFHAVASGYLEDLHKYAAREIGGYKKVRRLDTVDDLRRVAYYLSTHACREATRSTVRYFGKISYSKLARDDGREIIEDVICEKCGKPMAQYHCDDDGTLGSLARDHLTRKLIEYKYWKRGDKPRGLRKTRQLEIWGPAGPPGAKT